MNMADGNGFPWMKCWSFWKILILLNNALKRKIHEPKDSCNGRLVQPSHDSTSKVNVGGGKCTESGPGNIMVL